ncbi:MAG: polysaccharide deacetylase family protein [Wenzhouxiangellaceae bacterium]|nr:polysaccharide deacetylase family protein [Wenzhouxiangellaceae bacterium]
MNDRFIILTWHSINVLDNTPAGNDLLAFSENLEWLARHGFTILPLAEALRRLAADRLPEKAVALTIDDGSILDYHDFDHPSCGRQTSILYRLEVFAETLPPKAAQLVHASSFVIASPRARQELDRVDYMSLGVWPDDWWQAANLGQRLTVESHSWDHNHDSLETTVQRNNLRGDFRQIDTLDECRAEIDQASDYIEQRAGRRPKFLAYPYGQASDYLRGEYLPRFAAEIGLEAAFSCEPEAVTRDSDRWFLPRYVCGRDWKGSAQLAAVVADAGFGSHGPSRRPARPEPG